MVLLSGIPAWSPHGLCAAWPKPAQLGREIFPVAGGTPCCKHRGKIQPLTSPTPSHSVCAQIFWRSQQGGPGQGLSHTTAVPGPAVAPVAERIMCFTADGGKTWLWKMNRWKDTAELETLPSLGRARGYRGQKVPACFLQLECCRATRGGPWPSGVLVACCVWPCSVRALQQLMQRNPRGLLSILKPQHRVSHGDAAWTPAEGRAVVEPLEISHMRPCCARGTHQLLLLNCVCPGSVFASYVLAKDCCGQTPGALGRL